MGFYQKFRARRTQKGLLCVGLDPEYEKLPDFIKQEPDPLFNFCRSIVDATADYTSSFKPNIAFFESAGYEGVRQFENLIQYIRTNHPSIPIIADVKRADLGNTAKEYAKYYFTKLKVDAVTLSPYMGSDSITPFLECENGYAFLLCLTSNPGSAEFQKQQFMDGKTLYEKVASMTETLGIEKTGLVVGATNPTELAKIRKSHPELIFLVPGVGAQGGDATTIIKEGGSNCVVSVSRSILYASNESDFAVQAGLVAKKYAHSLAIS